MVWRGVAIMQPARSVVLAMCIRANGVAPGPMVEWVSGSLGGFFCTLGHGNGTSASRKERGVAGPNGMVGGKGRMGARGRWLPCTAVYGMRSLLLGATLGLRVVVFSAAGRPLPRVAKHVGCPTGGHSRARGCLVQPGQLTLQGGPCHAWLLYARVRPNTRAWPS